MVRPRKWHNKLLRDDKCTVHFLSTESSRGPLSSKNLSCSFFPLFSGPFLLANSLILFCASLIQISLTSYQRSLFLPVAQSFELLFAYLSPFLSLPRLFHLFLLERKREMFLPSQSPFSVFEGAFGLGHVLVSSQL